jgi:hypothetical protein
VLAGHAGKRNAAIGQVVHGNTPGSQGLFGGLALGLAAAQCVPLQEYQSLSGADFVVTGHLLGVSRVISQSTSHHDHPPAFYCRRF